MVESECRDSVAAKGVNAEDDFAFYSNEVTEILKAQPLNPFKPLTITAISRFPVRPPKADNPESTAPITYPSVEVQPETLTIEDHKYRFTVVRLMTGGAFIDAISGGRSDCIKEIEEVYAKLDEVIV